MEFEVTFRYDSDTKGTYKYVALDSNGKPVTESKERLAVGANVLYVQKDSIKKPITRPDKIKAIFTFVNEQ